MKTKCFIIVAIFTALTSVCSAQKLTENKKDDFSGIVVKRTSWENLNSGLLSPYTAYFRISQVGGKEFLDFKLMLDKVFAIDEGALISFKLDNGEVVLLPCTKYEVTCYGCGATGLKGSEAPGISVSYTLSKENAAKLKTNKVVKFRVAMTTANLDDDIKEKVSDKLQKSLALVD